MLDTESLPALSRAERVKAIDAWLSGLLADAAAGTPSPRPRRGAPPPRQGPTASRCVAVGSLGRGELPPHGDLDLVLVHEDRPEIAALADALWYPIWDAGLRLDHSVRTVADTVAVAGQDVKAGLGLLDVRLVAGDAELGARLRTATRASWRQSASRLLPQLRELRRGRTRQLGELAFLLEPDLKEAYGGLREGQVLRALAVGPAGRRPEPRTSSGPTRSCSTSATSCAPGPARPTDVLVRQEQRPVAEALGLADEDALLREVSLAGRRLAFVADETWRRVEAALVRRPRASLRRVRREPLADGVVRQGDEVVLARDAHPAADPGLLLRAAAAAARADLLLSPYTLKVLAVHSPPMPEPWPSEVALVVPAAARQRALGRAGDRAAGPGRACWHGCCRSGSGCARSRSATPGTGSPSTGTWSRRRRLPPSSPTTSTGPTCCSSPRCCTTSARAGRATTASSASRSRPRSAPGWASRPQDVAVLATLVRHHLLLPATATRRDIDDPATIDRVAETIGHDAAVLQLLHALAQADGAATSASAWSPWKAHLVAALVARVQAHLGVGARRRTASCSAVLHPTDPQVGRARTPTVTPDAVTVGIEDVADGQQVTIVRPDRPGLLSTCAGVLALNQLDVRAAKMTGRGRPGDRGLRRAPAVRPRAGARDPRRRRARRPGGHAAAGRAAAPARGRLPAGRRAGRRRRGSPGTTARSAATRPASSRCGPATGRGCSTGSPRRSPRRGSTSPSARIETLGADAVDCFYVCNPSGSPVDPEQRRRVEAALVRRDARDARAGRPAASGRCDTPT